MENPEIATIIELLKAADRHISGKAGRPLYKLAELDLMQAVNMLQDLAYECHRNAELLYHLQTEHHATWNPDMTPEMAHILIHANVPET